MTATATTARSTRCSWSTGKAEVRAATPALTETETVKTYPTWMEQPATRPGMTPRLSLLTM
jgi:hypothetical protein